ncbi:hypothetical protein PNOK_0729300 [Pyrrhoderma noxium]|uniref:Uncharacterized protein n=1 Tax=Pyrrhoderma noxium TaxID=2282107 RepID=A0A286UCF8_9AGAM|nr:hypothetical protein PNOK_0729300 [Pyrrhoderma noxium]
MLRTAYCEDAVNVTLHIWRLGLIAPIQREKLGKIKNKFSREFCYGPYKNLAARSYPATMQHFAKYRITAFELDNPSFSKTSPKTKVDSPQLQH